MKVNKDVLLYIQSFDANSLFDLEHNNKFYFLSEVLRSEMSRRIIKYNLNFCEAAILDLIDLNLRITDMINFKKLGISKEIKNLFDAVLQYENGSDTEYESIEDDDYKMLSEYSDTGEVIGFRNM